MAQNVVKKFQDLPKFLDGRIDYSTSDIAPVVTVFVMYEGKILLLKRSDKVRTYQGLWNTVAGYIDEEKPVEEIAKKELREELGVMEDMIESIKVGGAIKIDDKEISKVWIDYPVMARLNQLPEIKLDWEHSEYVWISPQELRDYPVVYMLDESLDKVL